MGGNLRCVLIHFKRFYFFIFFLNTPYEERRWHEMDGEEEEKKQATGFNICLPSLDNKNVHSLFFNFYLRMCED